MATVSVKSGKAVPAISRARLKSDANQARSRFPLLHFFLDIPVEMTIDCS